MKMTLAEIALFLGGIVMGADDTIINNIRSIEEANEGDITFIANKKYLKKLNLTNASAILAPPQTAAEGKNLIIVADPYVSLGKLLALFYPLEHGCRGVSPDAYIEEGAMYLRGQQFFPGLLSVRGQRLVREL